MTTQNANALCAACKVAPIPAGEGFWKCPQCGVTDATEHVLDDVKAHVVEVTARHFSDKARDMAKRSKFISFKPGTIPTREYKFISDFNP